ncbi:MAG: DUF2938 domain-containing protein [Gammaproteobacteria bacterium]|nr:DUF2938 domain-containing protein [Gammaproteobacteria bacterium]
MVSTVLVVGVVATITMDIWAVFLSKSFKLPTTNWAMVGRWLGHLPKGRFMHRPISSSSKINHELAVGWVFHYVVGLAYAFVYLIIVQDSPSLMSAITFGLATVSVPWLILQPGLGYGCFARLAPKPMVSRLISLSMHSVFGIGLYLGWVVKDAFY